jgi:hypothetical protein
VAPIGEQTLYPRIVQILDYYLILLGIFSVCAWLPLMIELGPQFLQLPDQQFFFAINAILSALILLTVLSSRRALVTRAGRAASLGWLIGSILWIGLLGFAQCLYIIVHIIDATTLAGALSAAVDEDMRGSVILFFPISYLLGLILIGLFGVWNWGDLVRWFPEKAGNRK